MLLIQPVITFSHRHFFMCVYTVFITDSQLFIFPPSRHSSFVFCAYFLFTPCLIFHLSFGFFSTSNSCVSRPCLWPRQGPWRPDLVLIPWWSWMGVRYLFAVQFSPHPLPQMIFPHCWAPATNLSSAFSVTEWEIKMWYCCWCSSICRA